MDREETARKYHKSGFNCSGSVYKAFSDLAKGQAPLPRSEGGKCGAVLAAEKLLTEAGGDVASFDGEFLTLFPSLKCADLRRAGIPCNDLVGAAARLAEKAVAPRGEV
ncbi:MAG: hypothetical protein IKX85_04520 [Clostridia bacterium]|nr:hypothetical protein [Clostridia bacterium]